MEVLHSGSWWGNETRWVVRELQGLHAPKGRVSWELRVAPVRAMPSPMGQSPTGSGHSRQNQVLPTGSTDSHIEWWTRSRAPPWSPTRSQKRQGQTQGYNTCPKWQGLHAKVLASMGLSDPWAGVWPEDPRWAQSWALSPKSGLSTLPQAYIETREIQTGSKENIFHGDDSQTGDRDKQGQVTQMGSCCPVEVFQTQPDKSLSTLVWPPSWPCFEMEVPLFWLLRSFCIPVKFKWHHLTLSYHISYMSAYKYASGL